ncbi:TPA: hypothetical protein ACIAIE_001256 [Serratia fonticola]
MSNNIWYLPGPFHQYSEDVKALAKANGLRIIDASATDSREGAADNVPEVTIRSELNPVRVGVAGHNTDGGLLSEINRLTAENADLRVQIEKLQATITAQQCSGQLDAEIDALKAKLTEAGVSFRANASKETLQKLAAEIPAE